MTIALELQQLKKTYPGGVQALRGIDLQVEAGDFYALLGPNGAGKSTTIGIISSLVNKTSGRVSVFGYDLEKDVVNAKRQLGLVPQEFNFNPFETVQQIVVNQAGYYGVERKEAYIRSEKYLKQLDLWGKRNERARMLSGGMKRRLMIARALMHHPSVLFLDEPTSGLDPESAQKVNQLIRNLAKENGITVFLCTHQLRYAQEICTRYGLIEEGKLLALGTLEQLRSNITSDITVCIQSNFFPEWIPHRQVGRQNFEVTIQSEEEIPVLIKQLVEAGSHLYQVVAKHPSLEDIYFALTQKEVRQ